ncbi:MAG: enoyl-CoA hydratase/isomerase family protein [Gammaproteobacteria bacterium]|nr:enoyl-CoA hydratase/isomerase family protein [Gammaproteobacteria bacterium]
MSEWVTISVKKAVATLTLNHPEKHNALSGPLVQALATAVKEIKVDPHIHLLVIKAAGNHFCAGANIQWMKTLSDASFEENKKDALVLSEFFYELYHLAKPTVSLVQGAALGGALGIISCCDLVIAHPLAQFGFSEVKLGLAPAVISPYVVAAMGVRQARRYFLTGEKFSSQTALRLGLVHHVAENLEEALLPYQTSFLESGPQAMAVTKELTSLVASQPLNRVLAEKTAEINARMRTSKEGKEGLSAFLEKRKPVW